MKLDHFMGKRQERIEKRQACYYILAYLLEHPQACDTLDGILEWWLLHQKIRFETQTVSQAVSKLVADGLIVEQKGPDSHIIYRAKGSENVQAMLNEMKRLSDD